MDTSDREKLLALKKGLDRENFLTAHGFAEPFVPRASFWERIGLSKAPDLSSLEWIFSEDPSVRFTADFVENADDLAWENAEDFARTYWAAWKVCKRQPSPERRDRLALLKWSWKLRTIEPPQLETIDGITAAEVVCFDVCLAADAVYDRAELLKRNAGDFIATEEGGLPC